MEVNEEMLQNWIVMHIIWLYIVKYIILKQHNYGHPLVHVKNPLAL